jgi:hypothetical protein
MRGLLASLVGSSLLCQTAIAQEPSGFTEIRGSWQVGTETPALTLVERARPSFRAELSERVVLSTTVEMALFQGYTLQNAFETVMMDSDFGPLLEASGCGWPDVPVNVFSVERLFVDVYHKRFDLRVGRQALRWGSSQFVNPTDPFPELLLLQPWSPRNGVNAGKITVPFGQVHDFDVVVGTTDTFDDIRLAGRVRLNWMNTDFSVIGAYRGEANNGLVGIDIRGTLGLGYWLEGAVHIGDATWVDGVIGLDYSLPWGEKTVLGAQVYYNGGATGSGSVMDAIQGPECADDFPLMSSSRPAYGPLLSSSAYGLMSAGMGVVPEVDVSLAWLQNFDDGTAYALSTVSTHPTGWLDVSLSVQVPVRSWGNGGEFSPTAESLRFEAGGGVADFSGLVPKAGVILWSRANF